ncbi:hypothetical protein OXX79_002787, partial [Metschnikowia pulcherrima]
VYYKAQLDSSDKFAPKLNANDLCYKNNLQLLLGYAREEDLSKILLRSYNLTHFVTKVDNDSYFAYLSDQIHFFFFYGAMSLVIVLKYMKDHNHLLLLKATLTENPKEANLKSVLAVVSMLTDKFERVAQNNPNDIITKYKDGIRDCVRELFPDVQN